MKHKIHICITIILASFLILHPQYSNNRNTEFTIERNSNDNSVININGSKKIAETHYKAGSVIFSSVYIVILLSGAIIVEKTGIKSPILQPELLIASFYIGYPISFSIGGHLFLSTNEQNSYNLFTTSLLSFIPSIIFGSVSALSYLENDFTIRATIIGLSMLATYFMTMGFGYWGFDDSYKLQSINTMNKHKYIDIAYVKEYMPNVVNVFNENIYKIKLFKIIF